MTRDRWCFVGRIGGSYWWQRERPTGLGWRPQERRLVAEFWPSMKEEAGGHRA